MSRRRWWGDKTVSHAVRRHTMDITRASAAFAARRAAMQPDAAIEDQLCAQIRKDVEALARLLPNDRAIRASLMDVCIATDCILDAARDARNGRELLRRQRAAILTLRCLTHGDYTPTWARSWSGR